jgi:hypothetical protein
MDKMATNFEHSPWQFLRHLAQETRVSKPSAIFFHTTPKIETRSG